MILVTGAHLLLYTTLTSINLEIKIKITNIYSVSEVFIKECIR